MPRLVSPNELQAEAKKHMLEGREPETELDWKLIVNFWAANLHKDVAVVASKLLGKIYNCPLPEEMIEAIAQFQVERKQDK